MKRVEILPAPASALARVFGGNVTRLWRHIPDKKSVMAKHGIKPSTLRTARLALKEPTLETVQQIATAVNTPAWLLLHPNGKEWDQNRDWIERIVSAYIAANDAGRMGIQAAATMAEQMHAPALAE